MRYLKADYQYQAVFALNKQYNKRSRSMGQLGYAKALAKPDLPGVQEFLCGWPGLGARLQEQFAGPAR